MAIRLLITDFDGTLVDTFVANYRAYKQALEAEGLSLGEDIYRACFGLRFDRFMDKLGILDAETRSRVRENKAVFYPRHFDNLRLNVPLMGFIAAFHRSGGKTAIASTARGHNLHNAINHLGIADEFDLILAGESVSKGKPDPEIYLSVLDRTGITAAEAIVFEDSEVGFEAARKAGIRHITVNSKFFSDGN